MRMLIVHNWYYHCLLLLVFPFFFLNLSFSLQFIKECILSNSISKEPCCLPKPTNMSKSRHSQLNEGAHRSILQRLRTEKDQSFFIYQEWSYIFISPLQQSHLWNMCQYIKRPYSACGLLCGCYKKKCLQLWEFIIQFVIPLRRKII